MPYYKVESSDKELFEYQSLPSVRRIKSDLGITNRKIKLAVEHGYYKTYTLVGTLYSFTITEVC